MKRFCIKCGKEAGPSDHICTECGTALLGSEQESVTEQAPVIVKSEKEPMPKKKKVLTIIGIVMAVILIAAFMFGKSYTSPENSLKRFHESVFQKDKKALKKMVQFESGEKLPDGQVEAIINYGDKEPNEFTQSIGEWNIGSGESHLFAFKKSGKVFGIFDGYKIVVRNQIVSVPFPFEDMEYTLNGEDVGYTIEEDRAIMGPVGPGIYELGVKYEGEYAETSQTQEIRLLERNGDIVYESLEFDISTVNFELQGLNGLDPTKVELLIGDKKIPFDEEGYIKSAGPFVLDGSLKVKTAADFPWGLVESEEIEVEDNYVYMTMTGIDEAVEKSLVDTVLTYGEQYITARVAGSTKEMKSATADWKKVMQESFTSEREYDNYFSGQLDEVQIDFESARVDTGEKESRIFVPVSFELQQSVDSQGEEPELSSEIQSCTMELIYVKDAWQVDKCQSSWFANEAGGTIVEGSKKLQKAGGKKKVEKEDEAEAESESKEEPAAKDAGVDRADLESFMQRYNDASVVAINENNYSKVSGMIISGAPRDKEQSDFIVHLNKSNITEDHLGTSLDSFKSIDDTTVEVTTIEKFNLHYPDKDSAEKSYTTVSQLKLVDGEWKMHKLVSTKER